MSLAELIPFRGRKYDPMAYDTAMEALQKDCIAVLASEFPPLSPLDLERQSIESKRERLAEEIDADDKAISYHEGEADRIRKLRAERRTILTGLDKHEAEINGNPCSIPAPATPAKRKGRG